MSPTEHQNRAAPDAAGIERQIVGEWRRLAGATLLQDPHRRTLIACSGGADSSALAIALCRAAPSSVVLAYIAHDLRPNERVGAESRRVRELAARLGVRFLTERVSVPAEGNAEDGARTVRYEALHRLAVDSGCPFVATGHHADDQWETVLMKLARGAGPGALAGMRGERRLDDVSLIRPMLATTHESAKALCRHAGWSWCEDETNHEPIGFRSRMRLGDSPVEGATRLGASLDLMADAAGLVEDQARDLLDAAERRDGEIRWPARAFSDQRRVVVGEAIRRAANEVAGPVGLDRVGERTLSAAWDRLRSPRGVWSLAAGNVRLSLENGRFTVAPSHG